MALAQVAVMLGIFADFYSETNAALSANYSTWSSAMNIIGSAAVSLFLVANFGLILQSQEKPGKLVLTHLLGCLAIYAVFLLFYKRYLTAPFELLWKENAQAKLDGFIQQFFSKFLSFNVFVDLLMCSSSFYFLTYKPKKVFTGKKIAIFRLFFLLPFAYEVGCAVVTGLSKGLGLFSIPVIVAPLFPAKPLLTYLAFLAIILFIRARKHSFVKKGKTEEEYKDYLKTNANSLSFSLFIAIAFVIVAIIDVLASVGLSVYYVGLHAAELEAAGEEGLEAFFNGSVLPFLTAWGFSKSVDLILGAPIILLFSYTRKHKASSKMVDLLLPLIGIALCVFVYLEGFHALLGLMGE